MFKPSMEDFYIINHLILLYPSKSYCPIFRIAKTYLLPSSVINPCGPARLGYFVQFNCLVKLKQFVNESKDVIGLLLWHLVQDCQ